MSINFSPVKKNHQMQFPYFLPLLLLVEEKHQNDYEEMNIEMDKGERN